MFFQKTFYSIKNFLSIYKPFCNLCSSDNGGVALTLPRVRTSTYGDRTFSSAVPEQSPTCSTKLSFRYLV